MSNHAMGTWSSQWDLIVIPCGARKRDVPSVAWQLYYGPYFSSCLKTALRLPATHYRILSGRYGLVAFDQILEPYEQRLDRKGAIGYDALLDQVAAQGLGQVTQVLGLCAGAYRDVLRRVWPAAVCPLNGGIGIQMQQLREIRRGAAPAPAGARRVVGG